MTGIKDMLFIHRLEFNNPAAAAALPMLLLRSCGSLGQQRDVPLLDARSWL